MPSTVKQVFSVVGLKPQPAVRWGTKPPTKISGVYIVSLSDSADALQGTLPEAPLAQEQFKAWMAICPDLLLDGKKPTVEQLMVRIHGFWLPDEVIFYIGLATSLRNRVGQYYSTPIGARRPHSGGYFLKLLSNLDKLWVHYAEAEDPTATESSMLGYFCSQVSKHTRDQLFDPGHPFPFANLEWPAGTRKVHGLRNMRA